VARDIRPATPLGKAQPSLYRPVSPADYATPSRYGITVLVRVEPGVEAETRLRSEVERLDARLTVFGLRRMDDIAREARFFGNLAVNVYGAMGMFAMLLACTGLAGVTAYTVARRNREIGIRMALGSTRTRVYRLVLEESASIIAIGGILGMGVSWGIMRALASVLNVLAESTHERLRPTAAAWGTLPAGRICLARLLFSSP